MCTSSWSWGLKARQIPRAYYYVLFNSTYYDVRRYTDVVRTINRLLTVCSIFRKDHTDERSAYSATVISNAVSTPAPLPADRRPQTTNHSRTGSMVPTAEPLVPTSTDLQAVRSRLTSSILILSAFGNYYYNRDNNNVQKNIENQHSINIIHT